MASIEINASSSQCRKCGRAYGRLKGNFPVSYAMLYKGQGYMPYCRECIDEMYDAYLAVCSDPMVATRQMCRKLDLYWDEGIYQYAELKKTANKTMMTSYIARLNSISYAGKSYDDTLIEEGTLWSNVSHVGSVDVEPQESAVCVELGVDPELADFWGADYSSEFLIRLDKRYKKWTKDQGDLEPGSVSLFKHICILEETIAMDSAAGRSVDKNMNTLNTLLGSLNLKPVQKKSEVDAATENTPFGVWIDRWEHKRPIPEPDPMLKDVDGIVRYITIWFYGHIAKTLGIPNVYCEMYEREMEKMKVDRPEAFDEEVDDDESIFNSIFGNKEV